MATNTKGTLKVIGFIASWLTYLVGLFAGLGVFGLGGWYLVGYHEIGGWVGATLWGVLWALSEHYELRYGRTGLGSPKR